MSNRKTEHRQSHIRDIAKDPSTYSDWGLSSVLVINKHLSHIQMGTIQVPGVYHLGFPESSSWRVLRSVPSQNLLVGLAGVLVLVWVGCASLG